MHVKRTDSWVDYLDNFPNECEDMTFDAWSLCKVKTIAPMHLAESEMSTSPRVSDQAPLLPAKPWSNIGEHPRNVVSINCKLTFHAETCMPCKTFIVLPSQIESVMSCSSQQTLNMGSEHDHYHWCNTCLDTGQTILLIIIEWLYVEYESDHNQSIKQSFQMVSSKWNQG